MLQQIAVPNFLCVRKIFGPRRDKLTGERRKLQTGELNLYPTNVENWASS
jgi:hypothetical protein